MNEIIFCFDTFNLVVKPEKKLCYIWYNGMPQWCGTIEELEELLKEVNEKQ